MTQKPEAAAVAVNHDCSCPENPLIPAACVIDRITDETPDVKTFRIKTPDGRKPFAPLPGQLAMISVPGVGEAMFSITAQGGDWIESSIKRVGELTDAMHDLSEGDIVMVRGPYGNHFPIEELKSKNLLFVGGGIGLAPLRSFIRYALEHKKDYGKVDILYGSRTSADLVFKEDLFENWPKETAVHVTIDVPEEGWDGHVGFVPAFLEEKGFSPENCACIVCGPPIMIRLSLDSLSKLGFTAQNIITTMEMRMKCGIGKCGRCNIGSKYVCLDGPVFTMAELDELPPDR